MTERRQSTGPTLFLAIEIISKYYCYRDGAYMPPKTRSVSAAKRAAVVTNAALRAAERLRVSQKVLANVIGVSESTVSRMSSGAYMLEPEQKSFELAVLFVRLYRSLDAIVGGDDSVAAAWLKNPNTVLDAEPLKLIQTVPGLMNVIQYLDARRAIV